MGRRRSELRNADGLILKLPISVVVQDVKVSFYKQIPVPLPLSAIAPSLRLIWLRHWAEFKLLGTLICSIKCLHHCCCQVKL